MRSDSLGMIWQDTPKERGAAGRTSVMPTIPDTGWTTPTTLPNLSAAKILAIDTETYDPHLTTHGPGWARNDGHVVGFSICTEDWFRWYFPIRHEIEPEYNLDPINTLRWLRDQLSNPSQLKVGANLMYDIGWLRHEGVLVAGRLMDVQFAEAIIDENKFSYSLDSIANKYVGEGKDTNLLYQWCADYYGGKKTSEQGKNFYRTPPRLMGPYAEIDAVRPLQIMQAQLPILESEGLVDLLDMECRLMPLLIDMRYRGVKVDIGKAEEVRDYLEVLEQQNQDHLDKISGTHIEVNASRSIEKAFINLQMPYTKTAKGNPSFTAKWLKHNGGQVSKYILKVRKYQKARKTFIENAILDKHCNGRIHCQFHPLKSDDGGTVSGRFSSRTPNLQQVPARDKEMAGLIRQLFIPDDGYDSWLRGDYSQIEYRLLAHFATGPGSNAIRKRYHDDPSTDYHQATVDTVYAIVRLLLERKPAKNINFGIVYGMGLATLCATLGISVKEGKELLAAYHTGVPFVSTTFDDHVQEALDTGIIRTILGRRSRFTRYVPVGDRTAPSKLYPEAVQEYGSNVQRAFTHKALNRRLQGSAADIMKKGMLDAYENGIFDDLGGPPQLTVHDELDMSYNSDNSRAAKRLRECMEETIRLSIPVMVDMESGPNWATVRKLDV